MGALRSQYLSVIGIVGVIGIVLTGCAEPVNKVNTSVTTAAPAINYLQYVDPFIGTDGKGKTYPGATIPAGMVQLSPDNGRNGWDWISGYFYPDDVIGGFSHTHLSGTGAGDLYDISFMPLVKPSISKVLDEVNPRATVISHFSHTKESASPGYYQVYLDDYQINVELTAALRTGVQRYTFTDEKKQAWIKLDLGYSRNWDATTESYLQLVDAYTVQGYRKSSGWAKDQRVYFYTRFSEPIVSSLWYVDHQAHSSDEQQAKGKQVMAELAFALEGSRQVEVKTSISSVSIDNAKQNYVYDMASYTNKKQTFAAVKKQAQHSWQQVLSKIHVEADEDNKVQFYTALYHSNLAPRVFSDSNGQYKGPDGNIHQSEDHKRYSFFSLWDTYRALHPWLTIVAPNKSGEMMHSLMAHYREYGLLPVWNFQGNETDMMMGYHAVPVLVDAYLKGVTNVDPEELFSAVKKSAMQDKFGIGSYQKMGFVPFEEISWNVSRTLEYAYDDWAIAKLAQALGKEQDYEYFLGRSKNYRSHYDTDTGFMRAKGLNGEFKPHFDPLAYHPEDYCEANAWQYNFYVPQDVSGMMTLMGGEQQFATKLDEMFTTQQASEKLPEWISGYIGQYVHGNEPAHHVPYLYQYAGQGHKTQQRVRQIMHNLYTTEPDGLSGNEDAGQMSAWYLFSALGFYPVDPVSGQYVLGSPEVNRAVIRLENGKTFTIKANNQHKDNVYVESVYLNGQVLDGFYLDHKDIMHGGELVFNMSSSH